MIHPQTGHECRVPKHGDYAHPKDGFTVSVSKELPCDTYKDEDRTCDRGTKGCIFDHVTDVDDDIWYAQIVGKTEDGERWSQMTYGQTEAEAVFMAYDIVKVMWGECHSFKHEDGLYPHCYCRDVTNSFDEQVTQYMQCCRCNQMHIAEDFDED